MAETLHVWLETNRPRDEMFWKDAFDRQIAFLQEIEWMLATEPRERLVSVVSTHRSKSITLPVAHLDLRRHGVEVWMRDNFHNWKLSVRSERPLTCDFLDLFDPNVTHPDCYCEGMDGWVFGSFAENPSTFTVEIAGDYGVWAFFRILRQHLRSKGGC